MGVILKLEEVDRGIEWAILDKIISAGLHPNKRGFLAANDGAGDEPGYQAALQAFDQKQLTHVHGVGTYQDRSQLQINNVIIDMITAQPGEIGVTPLNYYQLLEGSNTYKELKPPTGTYDLVYEIRFFCNNVSLDRKLNTAMLNAFGQGKYVSGIVDEALTKSDEPFFIQSFGNPVNMSSSKFIERVYRYIVRDVFIEEEEQVSTGISAVTQIQTTLNPSNDGSDQGATFIITGGLVNGISIENASPTDIVIDYTKDLQVKNEDDILLLPFVIYVDGESVDFNAIAISNDAELTITLATAVTSGQTVQLTYTRDLGGNELQDLSGLEVMSHNKISVVNNV